MHCFEFGVPEKCTSDMGSQLTAASDILRNFLKDHDTLKYFEEYNIKCFDFQHYFKGCSKLGSLVEICVTFTKKLIFGTIRNNILNFREFEFVISKVVHLVNKRPIALKENLSDPEHSVPQCITPENLLRGYDLISLNIIPELQPVDSEEWSTDLNTDLTKLNKVRCRLVKLYNEEFLVNLIRLATNSRGRYKPCRHDCIKPNDIVLIKEPNTKANQYPMAIVRKVVENSLGEITGAILKKGKSGEIIKRHSSVLIPYLEVNEDFSIPNKTKKPIVESGSNHSRPKRKAAIKSEIKTRLMLD